LGRPDQEPIQVFQFGYDERDAPHQPGAMPPPREGALWPHEKAKTTCYNRHCYEQRQRRQHEEAHIKDQRVWEIPQGD